MRSNKSLKLGSALFLVKEHLWDHGDTPLSCGNDQKAQHHPSQSIVLLDMTLYFCSRIVALSNPREYGGSKKNSDWFQDHERGLRTMSSCTEDWLVLMLSVLLIGSWKTKRGTANRESVKAMEAGWWNHMLLLCLWSILDSCAVQGRDSLSQDYSLRPESLFKTRDEGPHFRSGSLFFLLFSPSRETPTLLQMHSMKFQLLFLVSVFDTPSDVLAPNPPQNIGDYVED